MRPEIQQGRTHRTYSIAECSFCLGNLGQSRYARQTHHAHVLALALVVHKEERLVLHQRSAKRSSELVVMEWGFRGRGRIKVIPRIQCIVTEILEHISVQRVGSTFGNDVYDGAAVAAELPHAAFAERLAMAADDLQAQRHDRSFD